LIILKVAEGKSYLEAHTGLGRSDLLINIQNREYLIEVKRYSDETQFEKGKGQLAYYCKSLNLNTGMYLVFLSNKDKVSAKIKDAKQLINEITIFTYVILYDEEKDFEIIDKYELL